MDPAPATLNPRLSEAQALALFQASEMGKMAAGANTTTTLRFGLFSGNGPNPTLPDHHLTGSHPIGPLPAWIVLVDGIEMMPSGPGSVAGSPVVTRLPAKGYALAVISDSDGSALTGLDAVGGASAATTGIQ